MTTQGAHPHSYKKYFTIWCWLLFMTLIALGLGYVEAIHGGIKAVLLVGITLAKIFLIGSVFMHLKTEKVNLIMLTFSPLILSVILFLFTFGEAMGIVPTHQLMNNSPIKTPPGHHKISEEHGAEGAKEHK